MTHTVGVIGAGLSGLAAGLGLARHGFQVRLFEARAKLGGCCATTTIAGYTFNDGALYLAMPRLLDHAFDRLGLRRADILPLVRITAPQITQLPDGSRVDFGDGAHVRLLGSDGRSSDVDISGLLRRWNPMLQIVIERLAVAPPSLARLLAHAWRHLPQLHGSVADELRRQFADPRVRSAMAGLVMYSGLPADRTPAMQMLGLVCLFADGFHLPAGGMGQIPQCLAAALRSRHADLQLERRVRRIDLRRGRVVALEFDQGERVPVDAVVSTVSGMHTARLLGSDAPARMRRQAARAPLSHRAVAVQLGLRNRIDLARHAWSELPWMEDQRRYFEPPPSGVPFFHCTVPTVTLPDLAPTGGSVVEMFPPIRQDLAVDAWDDRALEQVAAAAETALARRHRLDIAVRRIVGPRQHRDDLGLIQGAIYGLSPAAGVTALFPSATAVPGLFQAGQSTYPGYGVASSVMSGVFAADALRRWLADTAPAR